MYSGFTEIEGEHNIGDFHGNMCMPEFKCYKSKHNIVNICLWFLVLVISMNEISIPTTLSLVGHSHLSKWEREVYEWANCTTSTEF